MGTSFHSSMSVFGNKAPKAVGDVMGKLCQWIPAPSTIEGAGADAGAMRAPILSA